MGIRNKTILFFLASVFFVIVVFSLLTLKLFNDDNLAELIDEVRAIDNIPIEKRLELLGKMAEREDIENVWKALKQARVGAVGSFTYMMGKYLYKEFGSAAMDMCDSEYFIGCSAGVVGAAVAVGGGDALAEFAEFCGDADDVNFRCNHGLGHGLAPFTGFDITTSLDLCDRYIGAEEVRPSCWAAVFQEYSMLGSIEDLKNEVSLRGCVGLPERHKGICALIYPDLVWGGRLGMNTKEIADRCGLFEDIAIQNGCARAIGYRIARKERHNYDGTGFSVAVLLSQCEAFFSGDLKTSCVTSLANGLRLRGYRDWEITATELCGSLGDGNKEKCFQKLYGPLHEFYNI